MKRLFVILGLAGCAFVVWQWWLSRRDPDTNQRDRDRKKADAMGQTAEEANLYARPRLASDERINWLAPIVTSANTLWSQIFENGTVNNGDKVLVNAPRDPLIFGSIEDPGAYGGINPIINGTRLLDRIAALEP